MTRAVVFAYSEVGVRCVQVLLSQGVQIPLLFTHADDPGESRWFGSVADLARRSGINTVMPDPNTEEWIAAARRLSPDFLFSFYYRYMLKAEWLSVASQGALNMHGSLLPKYRGRAPVHWAILSGETQTGASLHYMLEKPDAGGLVDQQAVPILEHDDALAVSHKVADAAATVMTRSLPRLIAGTAASQALDLAEGSYFGRRRPEDGRIDWSRGRRAVHDLVRAVAPPFPGAFTQVRGTKLFVYETRLVPGDRVYPRYAPCLYRDDGHWYVDFPDGGRLLITKMQIDGPDQAANETPPIWLDKPNELS